MKHPIQERLNELGSQVSLKFYANLDKYIDDLLLDAARRAKESKRTTVLNRDLAYIGFE